MRCLKMEAVLEKHGHPTRMVQWRACSGSPRNGRILLFELIKSPKTLPGFKPMASKPRLKHMLAPSAYEIGFPPRRITSSAW